MNVFYPASLAVLLMTGNLMDIAGLSTTSFVFGLLFVVEKIIEIFRGASWVVLFTASCGMWYTMWTAKFRVHSPTCDVSMP